MSSKGLLLLHPASGKMPRLTGALRNVTVPEGKSAEFTCSVAHLGGFKVRTLFTFCASKLEFCPQSVVERNCNDRLRV